MKGEEQPFFFTINRSDKTLEDVIHKLIPKLQESKI